MMGKKVMLIGDNGVGQDVEVIANYGDGGVLIEFHSGQRKLVGRDQINFDYFTKESKAAAKAPKYPEFMTKPGPIVPVFGKEDAKKSYPDLDLIVSNDVDKFVESVEKSGYTVEEIEAEAAFEELASAEQSLERENAELRKHNEYLITESKESAEIIESLQNENKNLWTKINALRDDVDRLGKYLVKIILKNNRA